MNSIKPLPTLFPFAITILACQVSVSCVERAHKIQKRTVAPSSRAAKSWEQIRAGVYTNVNMAMLRKAKAPDWAIPFPADFYEDMEVRRQMAQLV